MPSFFSASEQFELNCDLSSCWEFFSDLSKVAKCIPDCESVTKIDDQSAILKIKLKVGYVSKIFEAKVKLRNSNPPSYIEFFGEGSDGEILGKVSLSSSSSSSSDSAQSTFVKYELSVKANSPLGKAALSMIGKDLIRKQTTEFAKCVKSSLQPR